jgi:zinc transport system ATP-binding protein
VTILLVAHELGPAAGVVTRSICVDAGRITYDGPPLTDEAHHHDHGSDHHHLDHDDDDRPGRLGLLR